MRFIMKKLALSTIAAVVLSNSVLAHETHDTEFVFKGDKAYASFCRAVTQDNVKLIHNSFRNKVGVVAKNKKDVVRKLLDSNNLTCNGMNLVEFSKEKSASGVLTYLEKEAAKL